MLDLLDRLQLRHVTTGLNKTLNPNIWPAGLAANLPTHKTKATFALSRHREHYRPYILNLQAIPGSFRLRVVGVLGLASFVETLLLFAFESGVQARVRWLT